MYQAKNFFQCHALKFVGNEKRQCLNSAVEGLCNKCKNRLPRRDDVKIIAGNVGSNNYKMVKKCLKMWDNNTYILLMACHATGINTNSKIIDLFYFNENYPQSLFIQGQPYQLRLSLNVLNYIYEKIFLIGCLAEQDNGFSDLKKSWTVTKITKAHLKLLHQ